MASRCTHFPANDSGLSFNAEWYSPLLSINTTFSLATICWWTQRLLLKFSYYYYYCYKWEACKIPTSKTAFLGMLARNLRRALLLKVRNTNIHPFHSSSCFPTLYLCFLSSLSKAEVFVGPSYKARLMSKYFGPLFL